MSLFKSNEERYREKMEEKEQQMASFINRYSLNDLDEEDTNIVGLIVDQLGDTYAKSNIIDPILGEEIVNQRYLNALVAQNWIIIKKLDQLVKEK